MTRVKICGITNISDALTAIEAGADMIGYNFYRGSPRWVSIAHCLEIQEAIDKAGHSPITVGIFVNEDLEQIFKILSTCRIGYAQLSGDEKPEDLPALGHVAFKAVRPQSIKEAVHLAADFANPAIEPALLLDAHHPKKFGGTGKQADSDIARHIAGKYNILLAGGLTPDNVYSAVEYSKPWGVDVASGVESSPGVKDHRKIIAFIRHAKGLA